VHNQLAIAARNERKNMLWLRHILPNVRDEPRQRLARGVRQHDS
jgi:hypothetical protein